MYLLYESALLHLARTAERPRGVAHREGVDVYPTDSVLRDQPTLPRFHCRPLRGMGCSLCWLLFMRMSTMVTRLPVPY